MMATVKRLLIGTLGALALLVLIHPAAFTQDINCTGSFTPSFNCLVTGLWDFVPAAPQTLYDVPFKANNSEVTGIVSKVVDLTNAQVLALNTTPVTIVAAPGVGHYIDVISVNLIFNRTGAYTSPLDVRLYWGSRTTGNAASATLTGSNFFDATASIAIRAGGVPDNTNPPTTSLPIVIQQLLSSAMGSGNAANTVRVVVNYRIVATPLTT